jgi:uncharacterized membrane protein
MEQQNQKDEKDLTAILSYIGILFLIPMLVAKDNNFDQFHAKQGLVLFIAEVITAMFAVVPILGWIAAPILYIIWLVLSIIGIINVLEGNKKELPLIGQFANKFKI